MRVALLALFLTACSRTAPPAAPSPESARGFDADAPLPFDPAVRTGVLDNGLTWFAEPNPWPPGRAELRLVVKAGSVLEDPDQLGAAHFVEHMAFNGTERFGSNELIAILESTGMRFGPDLNAYTSFDETVYMLSVPTEDPLMLEVGLTILSEWADHIAFDPAEIEAERGVVLEEWRTGRGAGGRLLDAALPGIFHGSRYAERLPIGTEASLRTLGREELVRFYETWYRPDLMAVVVVGDVDPDRVEALVKAYFSDLQVPAGAPERPTFAIPDHEETLVIVQQDPEISQPGVQLLEKVDWSWGTTVGSYRDRIVEQLVLDMLNARLAEVAQDPEAPFLLAGVGRELQTPTRSVEFLTGIPREGQLEEGLQAMLLELRRAQVHGFASSELTRARARAGRGMETWWAEREHTPSSVAAAEIIRHFLHGESMPGTRWEYETHQALLPTITVEDVNARAATFLARNRSRVLVAAVPGDEPAPREQALVNLLDRVARADVEPWTDAPFTGTLIPSPPAPGSIRERGRIEAIDATVWTLSNGVRVIVKPTDFQEDQVAFAGWSWGGTSTADDDTYRSAAAAASVVQRSGLGPLNQVELSKYLAGRDVAVAPFITELTEGVHGAASPGDLETALQLVHLTFTEPRFDPEALRAELRDRAELLRNRTANPFARFEDALDRLRYGDHPRRRAWTVEDLEQVDLDEIARFYQARFGDADDFTFVFVGNVDLAALEGHVTTWLATLPTRPGEDRWRDLGIRERTGPARQVVRAGIEDRARVLIQMNGPTPFTRVERHRLSSVSDILEIRLREVLREELGGTYGVSVDDSLWSLPRSAYRLVVTFDTEPQRVEELKQAVYAEMGRLRREPVPPGYVQTWVAQELRTFELLRQQNTAWLAWILEYDQAGWPLSQIAEQPALIESTTPATVRQAARRYLRPDRAIELVLLPERRAEDRPARPTAPAAAPVQ